VLDRIDTGSLHNRCADRVYDLSPRSHPHHALKNGRTLEKAAAMANHAGRHTTQLYDRRHDEVERIVIELVGRHQG
jgi:hypothetical protein